MFLGETMGVLDFFYCSISVKLHVRHKQTKNYKKTRPFVRLFVCLSGRCVCVMHPSY